MGDRRTLVLATLGEDRRIAERNRRDWNDYLDDFELEHSAFESSVELLKGITIHWWSRVTDDEVSAAPVAFSTLFVLVSVPLISMGIAVDVTYSTAADIHLFGAYLLLVVAALRHRPPEFSPMFSLALAACATGFFHQALSVADHGNLPLVAPAMWVSGIGLMMMSVSGIRHRSSVGCSSMSILACIGGGALHAVAYLSVLRISDAMNLVVATAIALASALPVISLNRIWTISHRSVMERRAL